MGLPVQLNFYSNADVSLIDLMNTEDANFIGKHQVSLTNYDNTSLPAIAIGSIVENNGCLVKFTTECAISGSPSDGTVYIYLVPSGDPALGTATVTPTFTNTAPTWSDSKQGWYGTGGSANYRYLEFLIYKASTSYYPKSIFDKKYKSPKWKTRINAKTNASQPVTVNTETLIDIGAKLYDYNNEISLASDTFTAAKSAVYFISAEVQFYNLSSEGLAIKMKVDGVEVENRNSGDAGTAGYGQVALSSVIYLTAGQVVTFYCDTVIDSAYYVDLRSTFNFVEL